MKVYNALIMTCNAPRGDLIKVEAVKKKPNMRRSKQSGLYSVLTSKIQLYSNNDLALLRLLACWLITFLKLGIKHYQHCVGQICSAVF